MKIKLHSSASDFLTPTIQAPFSNTVPELHHCSTRHLEESYFHSVYEEQ